MKKKILVIALAVTMLAVAVIGGTIAYFTDTDSDNNVMTVGNVKIDQIENFDQEGVLMPGGEAITKEVTVQNIGTSEAYIRTIFAFEDTWDASALIHYDYMTVTKIGCRLR